MVPALNEARVIGSTIDRLLQFSPARTRILVVDDGSDDDTAAVARAHGGRRVWILSRTLPHARQGKGEALNAAFRFLRRHPRVRVYGTANVALCVLDADGRLGSNAIGAVLPHFADPAVGAVQVDVRMYNRSRSVLARLQDMEFVVFGDVFQRGRQSLGSAGLGGNGQFVRLSALEAVGERPWTDCLTEDLDLGVRLITHGWRTAHCVSTSVEQQAVTTLPRLVRQRARWFHGHMQCMRLVPEVMAAVQLSAASSFDVVYQLTSPILVLLTSLVSIAFLASATWLAAHGALMFGAVVPNLIVGLVVYVATFGMAPVFARVYRRREPSVGRLAALALAHLYAVYVTLWFAAGWMAVAQAVSGRRLWAKTERDLEVVAAH